MSKCATQPELLASASNDKTVRIWNLNDSTLMHTLRHTREVYGVAFQDAQGAHLDGILCVTASHDQKTRVWNVTRGICIKALQLHNSPVTCVSFQQNGELMVSGCQGNRVVLADTRSGLRMRTMRGHRGFITAVKIISSSNHLVSSSLDGTVRIWEIISSRNGVVELGVAGPNEPSHGHDKTVYALAFSPDASVLATGSRDFSIKLWDMFTAECKHTLIGHRNFVFSVAIHPTVILPFSCHVSPCPSAAFLICAVSCKSLLPGPEVAAVCRTAPGEAVRLSIT